MNRDEWEAICNRCGRCCYEKVDLGGGVIRYLDEACQYLDTTSNLCTVYHNRAEAEPDCISLTEQIVRSLNWLPERCAYVEYLRHEDTLAAVRKAAKRKTGRPNSRRRDNARKNTEG